MNDLGTSRLETERLILRRFELTDAEEVYNNWTCDPKVSEYVSWDPHKSVSETKALIQSWIERYDTNSYNWVVELKDSHQLIGNISAISVSRKHHNCEIGYCYGSKFWGNGYATEALKAVIEYMLYDCGFHLLEAKHHSANPASGCVMEKAGMKKEAILKDRRYDAHTDSYMDLVCYSIHK